MYVRMCPQTFEDKRGCFIADVRKSEPIVIPFVDGQAVVLRSHIECLLPLLPALAEKPVPLISRSKNTTRFTLTPFSFSWLGMEGENVTSNPESVSFPVVVMTQQRPLFCKFTTQLCGGENSVSLTGWRSRLQKPNGQKPNGQKLRKPRSPSVCKICKQKKASVFKGHTHVCVSRGVFEVNHDDMW